MCRPIGNTRERTGVDALSKLGCRLSTVDRLEKFHNASRVAENLGRSSVEDCRCASHYKFSVHRNAIERRLPVTLFTKGISALATEPMHEDYCRPRWSKEPR